MTRVAAVDCGTNTIKLLVADLDRASGTQESLVRELRIVRLGQDVDRTGRLADEALDRVFAAVEEYAAVVDAHGVEALRFVATSAARDAGNADVFVEGVRSRLGIAPEVVSGAEEAALSFDGATRSLPEVPFPVAVLDIGGGSTELIVGRAPGEVGAAHSLDIGSVRLTERLMPSTRRRRPRSWLRPGRSTRRSTRCRRTACTSATPATLVGVAGHRDDRRDAAAGPGPLGPQPGPPCVVRPRATCTTWPSGCAR